MPDYKIQIYWVRHGYSCANVIRDTIGVTDILHGSLLPRSKYSPDAQLANYGVQQTNETKTNNKTLLSEIQVVLTSELRRAIETALYLFTDKKIYPVPYVNERRNDFLQYFDLDKDNSNSDRTELTTYLKTNFPQNANNVDFSIVDEIKGVETHLFPADADKFFDIVIPKLIAKQFKDAKEIKILIVSHQGFIEKHLKNITALEEFPYINNADIWVENVSVRLDDKGQLAQLTQNKVSECGDQYKGLTCRIGPELKATELLNKDSFQRCNEDMKERLESVETYKPKEKKMQKGGYYLYKKYKYKYLLAKEQRIL
ncbi:MAG: histidine phosphatase superfamily branch 1 [Hyperionvirus sp.]|uniref:Histidine phosphatase superfamily branch 1 n=1 Tax=Hyperionvirus sp. TaxID=2487770 RepID=A0A3G5ABA6_9VIRU|nr:MAG: histidine phosphatase superfamily branch 1 [Hyperionvirus sp.]